ncbi:hypothetical protein [uncultured Ferrimonas sp.]|uniref:hypothetical protein n=1 Tax=uncultured Ferrimonas sp. TaxID=432640 RepID=UPI00262DE0DB|nr:hypothetical protein [uncultured Ferrimonas sp.]
MNISTFFARITQRWSMRLARCHQCHHCELEQSPCCSDVIDINYALDNALRY